jgi:hypothetical protein
MIFLSRLFLSMSAIAFLLIGLKTLYDPVAAMTAIELQPTSISAPTRTLDEFLNHFRPGCWPINKFVA